MGAKFSRVKVWVHERLKFADLNAEFDNILNNLTPAGIDGDSSTLIAMRATTNPLPAGVESLATTLDGEIQRLRYVLNQLGGGTYWYSNPGRNFGVNPEDLVGYLGFDGNTTSEVMGDVGGHLGLCNALSRTTSDLALADFDNVNFKFGNYSYKPGGTSILAMKGQSQFIGSLSTHFRNVTAGDYIAYNPLLGLELYLDGAGLLTLKLTKSDAASQSAKNTSVVAGGVSRATIPAFHHMAFRYTIGTGTDSLDLKYDLNAEGAPLNGSFLANPGKGGTWFFGAKRNDPAWVKYSAMLTTPDVEAVAPWTAINPGSGTVSNGILTLAQNPGLGAFYTKTTNVDLTHMTVDMKVKVGANDGDVILADLSDIAVNKRVIIHATKDVLYTDVGNFPVDFSDYRTVRVTSLGGPTPVITIYIDGVQLTSYSATIATGIGTRIGFGSTTGVGVFNFEYYAYHGLTATPPVISNTVATGNLDDIALFKTSISDLVETSLFSSSANKVAGSDSSARGMALPTDITGDGILNPGATMGTIYFTSDGKSPVLIYYNAAVSTNVNDGVQFRLNANNNVAVKTWVLATSTVAGQMTFIDKKVFDPGLAKLNVNFTLGGAATLTTANSTLGVSAAGK